MDWLRAGEEWGREHGLRHGEWMTLLPADVRYAVSARGRHHIAKGGLRPPWEAR